MKNTPPTSNVELPANLQASLDGLNRKYARKLEKTVLKLVKKMSGLYADLLDKELHAGTARRMAASELVAPATRAKLRAARQ